MATNDKTGSILITKDKYEVAAKESGLSDEMAAALWAKLADAAGSRIIAGATAPRQDATNVNNWHWFETDLAPWVSRFQTVSMRHFHARRFQTVV